MSLKVTGPATRAPWAIKRDRRMTKLERGVIRASQQVSSAERCGSNARAYGEIHQVINADPCTECALAEDRNLCVVLKEGGESECDTDRTREISAWKAWTKVGGLHSDSSPRIQRAWRTDPHAH
jgi:hypothetical protein